jgi:4-aminobutyrate aminotransferase-like enzyme
VVHERRRADLVNVTKEATMSSDTELLERRKHVLRAARLYYDVPFHPVRAERCWMYDEAGKRYLDAYNNVPHVGHGHPHVVAAQARQAAMLNTNTRYLFEPIVEYAERLIATMPEALDAVMFTCTGSEANDLAYRLARTFTGQRGVITTHNAYHGNTTLLDMIDGSSIKTQRETPDWWVTVPAPPDASAPGAVTPVTYAQAFSVALDALAKRGHRPAALFVESFFCTDGVRVADTGFIAEAIRRVRDAGALVIADEVQAGLARSGTHIWSFERLGIVPDIAVMGKPMGNGHPIGIVVARRDVVDAFYSSDRYFNTFAGNPVSCAIGCAVLDVVEKEKLQANALRVGADLKRRLLALRHRHPIVSDVRGQGLLLGVELQDPQTHAPAGNAARWTINELCRRGVLVGTTGPDRNSRNILKIRPPLVFDDEAVDLLVTTLDAALGDCSAVA